MNSCINRVNRGYIKCWILYYLHLNWFIFGCLLNIRLGFMTIVRIKIRKKKNGMDRIQNF